MWVLEISNKTKKLTLKQSGKTLLLLPQFQKTPPLLPLVITADTLCPFHFRLGVAGWPVVWIFWGVFATLYFSPFFWCFCLVKKTCEILLLT